MDDQNTPPSMWRSPMGIFVLIAGAIGVYYLLTEHLAHVTQAVPYLFLLACPLMHMFHVLGHRHGHGNHEQEMRHEPPPTESAERR